MAKFVLINLAEELGTGVTKKVEDLLIEKGDKRKAKIEKRNKGFFVKLFKKTELAVGNTVDRFDFVGEFDRMQAGNRFGISVARLDELRRECAAADKIYFCAHGSASSTDDVFAEVGRDLGSKHIATVASVGDLIGFLQLILNSTRTTPFNLTLIICFAARTSTHDVDHTAAFLKDPNHLKTSLSYKLFKGLTQNGISVRMTARLGEVRVSLSPDTLATQIVTQTEEGVLAGLAKKDASDDEQAIGTRLNDKDKYRLRQGGAPATDDEREWLTAFKEFTDKATKERGEKAKYGKLIYRMVTGQLQITLKYPKPLVLYQGPLL